MNFKTAKEYIEWIDEQSGDSWSSDTEMIAQIMEDYAKMYHERKLKLLRLGDVIGSVCEHPIHKREYYRDKCYKCWECLKIVVEQTDV